MKHFEFDWKSPSGKKVYAQGWLPEKAKPRAIVLLIHGLGEHSGRYKHVAQYFTDHGFGLFANDRVGHGKSGGKKGHIAKYAQTLDDIKKLHAEATRRFSSVPVFLYGHSMGGGIVLNYAVRMQKTGLKGIIASAPALKLAFEPSKFLMFLGKLTRNIIPSLTQGNDLEVTKISRDKAVVEAYKNDPLVHDRVSSETGMGLLEYGKYALENAAKANTPLLIMHGSADGLTAPEGSKLFAEKAKEKGDVTLKIWDGLYHEIHNEPEQKEVLKFAVEWIREKMHK